MCYNLRGITYATILRHFIEIVDTRTYGYIYKAAVCIIALLILPMKLSIQSTWLSGSILAEIHF